ncbi:hypothetical protein LAD12857_31160 [Lacrimispora amygdalina]|uniref:Uncharacterized protein n=1 Tax=Lacrimispora amygdalina TaxID=253257 RepID=A0A3E2N5B8_9FIRM|nr:hypothetical protein [Clostridium indicum]RFZ76188.1 hypothetical protein DS742_24890 [Clostridium indicum]
MSEDKKKQGESPAPVTLFLRLAGGGYLVWLAFQLVPELLISSGSRNIIQLVFMTLFFITGSALIIWSLKKILIKRPAGTEPLGEDEQEHIE